MNEGLWERICTLDFGRAVGRYVREVAELSQRIEVKNHEANRGKLRPADPHGNLPRLAAFVEGLRQDNQVLAGLQRTNPASRPDEYQPARDTAQFKLLRRLAEAGEVEPARALEGLVVAAVVDAEELLRNAVGARQEAEEIAAQKVADLERLREEFDEAAAARYDLQSEVDGLREKVVELQDQLDWERAGDPPDLPEQSAGQRKRRQKVEGEDHLYWSELASGDVVYELDLRGAPGDESWKKVDGGLDDAVRLRDEFYGVAA